MKMLLIGSNIVEEWRYTEFDVSDSTQDMVDGVRMDVEVLDCPGRKYICVLLIFNAAGEGVPVKIFVRLHGKNDSHFGTFHDA